MHPRIDDIIGKRPVPLPTPSGIALIDRSDGVTRVISHTPQGTLLMDPSPPASFHTQPFGPESGPVIRSPSGTRVLFSSNGVLSHEAASDAVSKRFDQPIFTKRFDTRTSFQITIDAAGNFVLTQVDF